MQLHNFVTDKKNRKNEKTCIHGDRETVAVIKNGTSAESMEMSEEAAVGAGVTRSSLVSVKAASNILTI